jgi:hypothetical protein
MLSDEDLDRIDKLHDDIDEILEGEDIKIGLNLLCSAIAGQCVQAVMSNKVTKQRFMAEVVQCIDGWHEHYKTILESNE